MKIADLPGLFRFVRNGVAGQFRCRFEVNAFPEDHAAVGARFDACEDCPSAKRDQCGVVAVCGECGCPLSCALRIPEKGCPLNRFPALTIDGTPLDRR